MLVEDEISYSTSKRQGIKLFIRQCFCILKAYQKALSDQSWSENAKQRKINASGVFTSTESDYEKSQC